jgi:hypothetical protein
MYFRSIQCYFLSSLFPDNSPLSLKALSVNRVIYTAVFMRVVLTKLFNFLDSEASSLVLLRRCIESHALHPKPALTPPPPLPPPIKSHSPTQGTCRCCDITVDSTTPCTLKRCLHRKVDFKTNATFNAHVSQLFPLQSRIVAK